MTPRPPNRLRQWIASLVLIVILAACAAGFAHYGLDWRLVAMAACGLLMGLIYIFNGGHAPQWLISIYNTARWIEFPFIGSSLNDDDDPENLSPKFFLPVLLGVLLIAALVTWLVLKP